MLLLIHAFVIIWITTNVRSQFIPANSTLSNRVIQLGVLLVKTHKVDVIIGPTCNDPALAVSVLGSYYNIPIMLWGSATAGVLVDADRFKTATLLTATSRYLATAVYSLCVEYGWNQFVFLYNQFNDNGKCFTMQGDFLTILNQYNDVDMAYSLEIIDLNPEPLRNALRAASLRGRIFVICADDDSIKLLIMMALNDLEINSNEYVYIFADARSKGFTIPVEGAKDKLIWETGNSSQTGTEEGRIAARNAFRNAIFVVDVRNKLIMMGQGKVQENYSAFGNEVIDRMKDAPFFCTTDCQLHDAMYSYGIALNRTIADDPSRYRDGLFIVQHMLQSFQGVSGPVVIDEDLSRNPTMSGIIGEEIDRYLFPNVDLMENRAKHREEERLDSLWKVPHAALKQVSKKGKTENSMRSFTSGPSSTSTKMTLESRIETRNFLFYSYERDPIVAFKHQSARLLLTETERKEMRAMKALENDNVCRFIGLCLDSPQMLSIWRYCSRGSLADVIRKQSLQMDNFFIYALLKDIVSGLSFIHNSFLQFHGHLTSEFCLIDDRWQIKVAYHGPKCLRNNDKYVVKEMLWTAPELLRTNNNAGSQEGEIYSLGIIGSELVTRKSVYDLENRTEKPEEIIYLLKKGGMNPIRPSLITQEQLEINPALLHLIRDCWTERPSERPTIDMVRNSLRSMNTDSRSDNLMDHVFTMMESYATVLEDEVDSRTKELVEEKKKSDLLLYRMLPKQVAEKLKLGQPVEPETFESVTLFFSDVVSFTKLAAKCTPLQVVNLLNDLYTLFDNIIDQHDVYKVETIGDGYLCVSGLPHRNGNEHARHVALMSLQLIKELVDFRVPHLPTERINIRIGVHCVVEKNFKFKDSQPTTDRQSPQRSVTPDSEKEKGLYMEFRSKSLEPVRNTSFI
ncbi:hypothetical protein WR25_10286 [Diploscapter pachys]|uniref:guanylate cyclase n=1 Tax=Diploscapter pachys TaxID=2018661 RepID=A0A2A2JER4_9BILA|nr:hypothetical protein WR25_10286 [Diploscapter pachys]